MRILISGINGFVGSHLAEYCLAQGDEVHGTVRNRSSLKNIEHILDKTTLHECELTDAINVTDVIKEVMPDKIFHLAAQSYVPTSWKSPAETLVNNIVSELNILESVRKFCSDCKIHIAGTSEEYGMVEGDEIPTEETNELRPLSPYGVSKVTQDKLGCQYHQSYGLKVVVTRAFNHTGPRRGDKFVCASFAKQIAETGNGGIIKVGNLEAYRDFTDVRDVVRAYYMALSCNSIVFGETYNICSGDSIKIQYIVDKLIEISGKNLNVEQDPDRMRPSDLPVLEGDCTKFKEATGWEPKIPFDKTLVDIYDYYV